MSDEALVRQDNVILEVANLYKAEFKEQNSVAA